MLVGYTHVMDHQDQGFKWLDEQLRLANMDVAELARRGGFDKSTITHARKGNRRVGRATAQKIAFGLGVSQTKVFQEFGLMEGEDKPEDEAIQLSKLLMAIEDPEERKRTVGIITAVIQQVVHTARTTKRLGDSGKPGAASSRTRRPTPGQ